MDRYEEIYQSKVGSTLLLGDGKTPLNYNLKTFDGGKSWWSVVYDDNFKIISIEPADPEVVKHHDAMIQLGNYAREHGPINGSDPEGIKVLDAAGFTVETNK